MPTPFKIPNSYTITAHAYKMQDPFIRALGLWMSGDRSATLNGIPFASMVLYRYPMNNVLRHLTLLFLVRVYGRQNSYSISGFEPKAYTPSIYINRQRYARMFMPLFTNDVFSRLAEFNPDFLKFFQFDTELLRSLNFNATPYSDFLSTDQSILVFGQYASQWKYNGFWLNLICSNPHFTEESALRFAATYRSYLSVSNIQRLILNTSIPLDCLPDLFRVLNLTEPQARAPYEFYVKDRFDYPCGLLGNDILYQSSTPDQIDRFVRKNLSSKRRINAARHPNMSDELYAKILGTKRESLLVSLLRFDRTDTFYVLQQSSRYPDLCRELVAIRKASEQWKHVLDRQLEIAKDPNVFFPKTEDDVYAAIESFKL